MNVLFAIDDTDVIGTPGTGHLAKDLIDGIHNKKLGQCSAITRHQLFVHEDVPYTSHNSAMCFEIKTEVNQLDELIELGARFLKLNAVEGSDPGLCVAVLDEKLDKDRLINYGQDAKSKVLTKEMAYRLASDLGVHLSEHGGSGQGVVGALAGVGLRCGGNDGRFRGWHGIGRRGDCFMVHKLREYDFIDTVMTVSGRLLDDELTVRLSEDRLKLVYQNFQNVVLVDDDPVNHIGQMAFNTLPKIRIKQY